MLKFKFKRWPRRSLEIEHWPFDCAKRLHIGDSNLESPISNLLGHRAKRLHIGDSNFESPISNLLGHRAKRLHIGDSNLESPISNLLGHRAKRLHIGDSNLEFPISYDTVLRDCTLAIRAR